MDLTKPIDISGFNDVAKRYESEIKALPLLKAGDALQYFTPMTGVRNSVVITKMKKGAISKKYTGTFSADKTIGTPEQRTLTVYPCVAEMSDEPERYRKTFIDYIYAQGVAADIDEAKNHPFLRWLVQYGISVASEELFDAIWVGKLTSGTRLQDSFDGIEELIRKAIVAGEIAASELNYYDATTEFTSANIGDKLKEMWRMAHKSMRDAGGDMFMSVDLADMYDDWYREEHDKPPMVDAAGQLYLEGSNGKCRIIRLANMDNQRVILTTKDNIRWGTDSPSDMQNMKAFNSGNPYVFTATMKYVFGLQFASVNWKELIVSKRYDESSGSGS
jgi:hypothetical protein